MTAREQLGGHRHSVPTIAGVAVGVLTLALLILWWNWRLYWWFVTHGIPQWGAAVLVCGPFVGVAVWLVVRYLRSHGRARLPAP